MSTGYKIKDQERWCFINTSGSWWKVKIVVNTTINGANYEHRGIQGYQNARNAGLNPWTGDFTKETKAKLAFNGKYDWNEKIAARDAKKFIKTVHPDLSKEAGYPTYSIKDLDGARGSTPTPNPNKLLNNPTGLKSNITLDPSVLKRAKRLYMTSFHELSHAKDIFGGQMYTDMKWFMNTHKLRLNQAWYNAQMLSEVRAWGGQYFLANELHYKRYHYTKSNAFHYYDKIIK